MLRKKGRMQQKNAEREKNKKNREKNGKNAGERRDIVEGEEEAKGGSLGKKSRMEKRRK